MNNIKSTILTIFSVLSVFTLRNQSPELFHVEKLKLYTG